MHRHTRTAALAVSAAALLTLLAACGTERAAGLTEGTATAGGALAPDADGVVALQMEDIKFDTTSMTVHTGQIVEFHFTNAGKVPHDAFIGDTAAQAEHEKEMAEMTGHSMTGNSMAGHSSDEPAVIVEPGEAATLTYTFDTPGTYEIGCHQPGHYSAGMKVTVTVD